MRVILDECLPRRLLRDLSDHSATTVSRQGWAGVTNGALLELVEPEFDVFLTMDYHIVNQQNMAKLGVCLIVLHGPNSNYETLQPLVPQIQEAIARAEHGSIIHLGD